MTAFGQVLRQLRTESQLTQEEFAFAAGLQRNHISSLELGNKQPTLLTIYKISLALNLTPGNLLDRVDALLPNLPELRDNVI
ncbi:helix-turn-helix domain-containing protein [Massilia sp. P8910]|uniref:helix-turn-helix domain-containing protein n=1 Tax=Massilia antarctica TaxID=2765360 RepID=UPI001E34CBF3|nr:helix-turn-helix transcriptional regulator [Massilia antarctica]MCE3606832.1 helix-turn-helix domain-containing protein [Massilia antarctica]